MAALAGVNLFFAPSVGTLSLPDGVPRKGESMWTRNVEDAGENEAQEINLLFDQNPPPTNEQRILDRLDAVESKLDDLLVKLEGFLSQTS